MIIVRRAEKKDEEELAELFLVTRRDTFLWEDPNSFKLSDFERLTCGETVFVAEDASKTLVGMLSVWEEEDPPFIHNLFVHPLYQGRGIGMYLLGELKRHAIFPPYQLKCVVKNEKALKFYKKYGFLELERGIGEEGEYILLEGDLP